MVPEQNPLSGVKVMVIDDSNTIRRSAEIFLLQAGMHGDSGGGRLRRAGEDHRSPARSRLRRHHDAAARRLPDVRAHQEEREVPEHAGDHALVEGRAVRPGPRADGRLRPVPDQAVHQGQPAQDGRDAREPDGGSGRRRRRRADAARRHQATGSPQ